MQTNNSYKQIEHTLGLIQWSNITLTLLTVVAFYAYKSIHPEIVASDALGFYIALAIVPVIHGLPLLLILFYLNKPLKDNL